MKFEAAFDYQLDCRYNSGRALAKISVRYSVKSGGAHSPHFENRPLDFFLGDGRKLRRFLSVQISPLLPFPFYSHCVVISRCRSGGKEGVLEVLRLILLRVKKIPSSVFNSSDDMLSTFFSNALKFVPHIAVICVIAEFMPQSGFGTFHLLSKKSSRSNIFTLSWGCLV